MKHTTEYSDNGQCIEQFLEVNRTQDINYTTTANTI